MKNPRFISVMMAVIAEVMVTGCTTTTTSTDRTISITMNSVSHQFVGKSATIEAIVVSTTAATGTLGEVTWGLDGVNYTSTLSGVSSSEVASLTCPASLTAGNYPVTASVSGVTAIGTLKVVNLAALYSDMATTVAPVIKTGFATGTYLILKNNPDLVDTFSVSTNAVSTILCASDPTASGFKVAIMLAYPDIDSGTAEIIATALESAYATMNSAYKSQSGSNSNLSLAGIFGDSAYSTATQTLVKAATEGTSSGIAAFKNAADMSD